MRPLVWLQRSDGGDPGALGPGDWVGRATAAALRLDDPRVSEAHAMVSLRGQALWLLALRGRLRCSGRFVREVELDVGREIELAEGLVLTVSRLHLPAEVLALRLQGLGTHVLHGTTSLFWGPPATLRPGADSDADAVLWTLGERWRLRTRDGEPIVVAAGDEIDVGGPGGSPRRLSFVAAPIAAATRTRTHPTLRPGYRFEVGAGVVRVASLPAGERLADVTGVPGRLLAALLSADCSLDWRELCEQVWPGDRSQLSSLRNRVDVGLTRLRERLRAAGLSEIAIALDGSGAACVHLAPIDRVVRADVGPPLGFETATRAAPSGGPLTEASSAAGR